MREIKYIVLHCTATPQNASVESIQKYWKENLGWKSPGYHFIIKSDGTFLNLQPIEKPSNGVSGYNECSIHISYIGGVDRNGKAIDNRTPGQLKTMEELVRKMKTRFPLAEIKGHRDFPGVKKECPSFNVKQWINKIYERVV